MKNPFSHWGIDNTLSPLDEASRREEALADGLRELAKQNGVSFAEPLGIDSRGEFHLTIETGEGWGETIAQLLNDSNGARCGIYPTRYHEKSGRWCMLNHFAAQSILEKFNHIKR